ncbi:alpha/beta hydrolase [Bittarella massiliensis (ex Durand et al. 2017)]|uniref:alpha/beta hydrolase n=1 Tax=Bittarella massiliensis (ex Durand et al. 2017) TaxID=1720313 RepID=UPI001AA1CD27|nr:alpha/beta hydrolase [Bittarella massiliensis (ex Durand et al. 2017)]
MKGRLYTSPGGTRCYLLQGWGQGMPAVHLLDGDMVEGMLPELLAGLEVEGRDLPPLALVLHSAGNRDDDYTPWPAPNLKKRDRPFGGGAAEYLPRLCRAKEEAEAALGADGRRSALLGYSLGGLFALWAAAQPNAPFAAFASLSGSLWYDGWREYAEEKLPQRGRELFYLSLGEGEEHTRMARLAPVGDCTRALCKQLQGRLDSPDQCVLEWNPGGHVTEIAARHGRALRWLAGRL